MSLRPSIKSTLRGSLRASVSGFSGGTLPPGTLTYTGLALTFAGLTLTYNS